MSLKVLKWFGKSEQAVILFATNNVSQFSTLAAEIAATEQAQALCALQPRL